MVNPGHEQDLHAHIAHLPTRENCKHDVTHQSTCPNTEKLYYACLLLY